MDARPGRPEPLPLWRVVGPAAGLVPAEPVLGQKLKVPACRMPAAPSFRVLPAPSRPVLPPPPWRVLAAAARRVPAGAVPGRACRRRPGGAGGEFGDVVLVPFPFTSQADFKRRAAIVFSNAACNHARPDVVVMAITSQLRPVAGPDEVWLAQRRVAGLLKPSYVKPVFATLEQHLGIRQLGILHAEDQAALRIARSRPR
jgi:mRNA interferase MazF